MMKAILKFIIFLFYFFYVMPCFPMKMSEAYAAYEKKDYKKSEDILKGLQAKNPFDSQINYNLGNVFYKQQKFEDAVNNFERAFENATKDQFLLKEKACFNGGNSFYMNALKVLGTDWESRDCSEKELDSAALLARSAIERFKKVLEMNNENLAAKNNLQRAEELLKEIEEKRKQQEEQKQKEQEEQQEKREQEKREQEKKENDKKDEGGKGEEKKGENPEKPEDGEKDEQEKSENPHSDPSGQGQKGREDKDLTGEEKKEEKSQGQKQEKGKPKSDSKEEKEQESLEGSEEEKEAEKGGEQKEAVGIGSEEFKDDKELRGMSAILDKLQANDAKKQKMLMKHMVKGRSQLKPHQKNW